MEIIIISKTLHWVVRRSPTYFSEGTFSEKTPLQHWEKYFWLRDSDTENWTTSNSWNLDFIPCWTYLTNSEALEFLKLFLESQVRIGDRSTRLNNLQGLFPVQIRDGHDVGYSYGHTSWHTSKAEITYPCQSELLFGRLIRKIPAFECAHRNAIIITT